jgi:apolipoprotein N-acyltransferase
MNRVVAFCRNHYYLLTSILIFLSFPSYDLWIFKGFPFFAWISLVPVFMYVRGKRFRDAYVASFVAGFAGSLLAYDWIGHFGQKLPGGEIFVMTVLSLCLAVFFAVKVSAAELLSSRFEKLRILIFPCVWIIVDWVESIGFLAFPWPYWGYSQYPFTAFIQIASITGILGVNFVIVIFNYALADLIRALARRDAEVGKLYSLKEVRAFAAIALLLCVAVVSGVLVLAAHEKEPGRDMRVALVQTCISPWEDWEANKFRYLSVLEAYTDKTLAQNPDFIIWSESATLATISYDYDSGMLDRFDRDVLGYARSCARPLLTGEIGIVDKQEGMFIRRYPQNSAVLINGKGEVVKTYPKIHLVPFGEWFPYEQWFPAIKRLTMDFGASSFVPGDRPVIFEVDGRRFGVLICYEGIFYRLCREYKNLGADFLVNITNDGWTHTYKGHMQHFAASVLRAVENGIWYVRAGNTGYTALIDPYGRIRESIPILKKGFLVGDLDFSANHRTVYSVTGDTVLYVTMAFIAVLIVIVLSEIIIKKFR